MSKESTKAAFQKAFSNHALLHLTYEELVELGAPETREGEPRYCSFGPGCRCEKIPVGKPNASEHPYGLLAGIIAFFAFLPILALILYYF